MSVSRAQTATGWIRVVRKCALKVGLVSLVHYTYVKNLIPDRQDIFQLQRGESLYQRKYEQNSLLLQQSFRPRRRLL